MNGRKKYFIRPYIGDEFNQMIAGAVTCDLNRKHFDCNGEYWTFSFKQFVGLNNAFDKIIVHEDANLIHNYFQIIGNAPPEEFTYIFGQVMALDKVWPAVQKYCAENDINTHSVRIGELFKREKGNTGLDWHPYDYNYCYMSRNMQEGSFTQLTTTAELYAKYSNGDKKTIVVNGRNYTGPIKGQYPRNNLFERYMVIALKRGFKVINVTDLKPGLNLEGDYVEIDNNNISYLEKIAMFQNANAVISVGNAGGITTHLCTRAHFYCYCNTSDYGDRWADNDLRYSWNGKSIADARREMWPDVKTNFYHNRLFCSDDRIINEHLDEISSLKKPLINLFFDESKIVYLR